MAVIAGSETGGRAPSLFFLFFLLSSADRHRGSQLQPLAEIVTNVSGVTGSSANSLISTCKTKDGDVTGLKTKRPAGHHNASRGSEQKVGHTDTVVGPGTKVCVALSRRVGGTVQNSIVFAGGM